MDLAKKFKQILQGRAKPLERVPSQFSRKIYNHKHTRRKGSSHKKNLIITMRTSKDVGSSEAEETMNVLKAISLVDLSF